MTFPLDLFQEKHTFQVFDWIVGRTEKELTVYTQIVVGQILLLVSEPLRGGLNNTYFLKSNAKNLSEF